MKLAPTAFFLSALLVSAASTSASVILDVPVESSNGWTNTGSWTSGFGALPTSHEGSEMGLLPDATIVDFTSPFLPGTLQAGTYTISYAVGSSTTPVVLSFGNFLSGENSTSTNIPGTITPGTWQTWSATFDVAPGNLNIGRPLQFSTSFFSFGGEAAFDGVGSLDPNNNGLVVDFVAAVPEASEALVVLCGMTALVFGSRRRKRR